MIIVQPEWAINFHYPFVWPPLLFSLSFVMVAAVAPSTDPVNSVGWVNSAGVTQKLLHCAFHFGRGGQ